MFRKLKNMFKSSSASPQEQIEDSAKSKVKEEEDGMEVSKLELACAHGRSMPVQVWLALCKEQGTDPYTVGPKSLHLACRGGHDDVVEALLEAGFKPDRKDFAGFSSLHHACFNGAVEVFKLLIEAHADVNLPVMADPPKTGAAFVGGFITCGDGKGVVTDTPLSIAAKEGHLAAVELLIENGADVTKADFKGATAMHMAVISGSVDLVRLLHSKGASVNDTFNMGQLTPAKAFEILLTGMSLPEDDPRHELIQDAIKASAGKEMTPLGLVMVNEKKDCVLPLAKLLLELGADINSTKNNKCTALTAACIQCEDKEDDHLSNVVELLVKSGADINLTGEPYGQTPLHMAAMAGNAKIVELLLKNGADAKVKSEETAKVTPLHLSESKGRRAVTKLLITHMKEKGISLDIPDGGGHSALCVAIAREQPQIALMLVDSGANVNMDYKDGITVLALALYCRSGPALTLALIKAGADVNAHQFTEQKRSVLQTACLVPETTVQEVKMLLEAGAKVDYKDRDGMTALHIAAQAKKRDVYKLLVEHGADQQENDNRGNTPLSYV